jgi:serine/threonine-protein kinase
VKQSPNGNATAAKGSTVTIFVSKGPKTTAVPDVTSQDVQTAGQTLHAAGFNVHVTYQDTNDPAEDNIVLNETPQGNQQAAPGTVVNLVVGRLTTATTTTGTTTTTP